MENFIFPNGCTFCQSRIGSANCLLPYNFVVDYVPPEHELSRAIDLVEIHTTYGVHKLRDNFELIHWMKTRPSSEEIQSYAGSVLSFQDNSNEHHSSSSNLQSIDRSYDVSEHQDTTMNQPRELTNPEPEASTSSKMDDSKDKLSSSLPTFAQALQGVNVNSLHDPRDYYSAHQDFESTKSEPKLIGTRELVTLDRKGENHLIQDLLMATKAAYNMHQLNRSYITCAQLNESILYESELKHSKGKFYSPSFTTKLDGQIALSKELAARHTTEHLLSHINQIEDYSNHFCLLNFPFLHYGEELNHSDKLEDALVHYFEGVFKLPNLSDEQKEQIFESLKFELERQELPLAYRWIKNQAKILKMQSTKPMALDSSKLSKGKQRASSHETSSGHMKHEPYPPLDQDLLDYIDTHLMRCVQSNISRHNSRLPVMSDETKLHKFLFSLTSEFLKRNKGWQNLNSFTTAQHLTKLEKSTGLRTKSSESLLTFKLLKSIIDDFRSSYKTKK